MPRLSRRAPGAISRDPSDQHHRLRDLGERELLAAAGLDVSNIRPGRKPGTRVFTLRNGTCNVPTLFVGP